MNSPLPRSPPLSPESSPLLLLLLLCTDSVLLYLFLTFRTCNELNAGYAADGYCRHRGVGACVVTYGVGGFSVINAAAGCYSEDLPVIFITGGLQGGGGTMGQVLAMAQKC